MISSSISQFHGGCSWGFSFVTFIKSTFPPATPKEQGGIPERATLQDFGLGSGYFGNSPLLGSYLTLKQHLKY
jgi:hypothetical protein